MAHYNQGREQKGMKEGNRENIALLALLAF